jgi:hypothetical protein
MKRLLAVLALAAAGCGSSSSGPVTYILDRASGNSIPAGGAVSIGPFSVPSGAIITYSIVDTPVGIGDDSLTFAIDPGGYAAVSGPSVSGVSTPPLPGGYYSLDVWCDNFVDPCYFDDQVTATY